MVTKVALSMLASRVVKGAQINGMTLVLQYSDDTTQSIQVGNPDALTAVDKQMIVEALGYTPIDSLTKERVIEALGYTPINKAGDNMLGRIFVASGNAATPGITFDDDAVKDTGFFHISDGAIGVSLNGTHQISFGIPAAGISCNGNISGLSDQSIKTDIEVIEKALLRISRLSGITYRRTDMNEEVPRETGLIAQQVQAVLPEAVREREDGKLVLAYGNLAGLFVEAIKELDSRTAKMQEEVNALKSEIKELKGV